MINANNIICYYCVLNNPTKVLAIISKKFQIIRLGYLLETQLIYIKNKLAYTDQPRSVDGY